MHPQAAAIWIILSAQGGYAGLLGNRPGKVVFGEEKIHFGIITRKKDIPTGFNPQPIFECQVDFKCDDWLIINLKEVYLQRSRK